MLSDLDGDELEEIESRLYSQIHYGTITNDQSDNIILNPAPIYFCQRYYQRTTTPQSTHTTNINDSNVPPTAVTCEQNVILPTPDPQESVNIPSLRQNGPENQQPVILSSAFHHLFKKAEKIHNRNLTKKALKAKTQRIAKAANEDAELFRNLSCEERKSVFKYQKKQRYLERKRLRKLEKQQTLVDQYNNGINTFQSNNLGPQLADLQLYPLADIQPPPAMPKEKVETITQPNNDEVVSLSGSEGSSCIAVDLPAELLIISDDDDDLTKPPKNATPEPKIEKNTDEVKIEQDKIILSNDVDDDDVIYIEQQPVAVIDLDPESVIKEAQPPTDSELMKPPDSETLSLCSVSSNNLSAELKANTSKTTPKKAKVASKEREELLSTPELNDFLDSTLDVEQDNFNFSLHGTDFNTSKDLPASKTLADMCGSESSWSASDVSAPVKTPIFSEIDFGSTSKGLFSENNLKSFSEFITPIRTQITPLLTPSREIFKQVPTKTVGTKCDSNSDSSSESEYGDIKVAQGSKKLPDLSHFEINKAPKSDQKGESTKKKKKKKCVDIVEELVPNPKDKKRKKGKGLDFANNSGDEKDETKPKKKKGKKGSSLEGSDIELTPKRTPRKEEEAELSDKKPKRKKNKEDDVTQSATKKLKRKKRVYDEWIENNCSDPCDADYVEVDEDVLNTSGESCSQGNAGKKINIISEQVLNFQFDFNKYKSKKGKKSNDETEEIDAEVTSEIGKSKKSKKSRKSSELQGDDDGAGVITEEAEAEISKGKKFKKSRKSSELQEDTFDVERSDGITEEVTGEIIKGKKSKKCKKFNDLQEDTVDTERNDEEADGVTEEAKAEVTTEITKSKKLKKSRKSSELQEDTSDKDRNGEGAGVITEEAEADVTSEIGKSKGKKVKKSRKTSELHEECKDVEDNVVAEEAMEVNEVSSKQMKRTRKVSENKKNTTDEADEIPAESNETTVQAMKRRRKSCENIRDSTEATGEHVEIDPQEGKRRKKSSEDQEEDQTAVLQIETDTIDQQNSSDQASESVTIEEPKISKPMGELPLDNNLQNSNMNPPETPLADEPKIELPVQDIENKSPDHPEQKYSDISDPEDDANAVKNLERDGKERPKLSADVIDIDVSDSDVEIIDDHQSIIEVGDSDSESVPCNDPNCKEVCDSSCSSSSSGNELIDLGTAGKDIELINLESNTGDDAVTNRPEITNRPERFSDHFARDMNEFYTQSYGAEKLSLQEIQEKMTDNPSKWKILERDRVHIRFGKERGPRCRRCREIGHIAPNCRNKVGPPKCCLCGNRGHFEPRCPNKICTQCGRKCFETTVFCSKCAYLKKRLCKLCKMIGHEKENCPDIWRRYHLTITEGPTVQSTELPLKPCNKQWCSGCAQNGHLEHECNYYGREHPPAAPYIVDYEEVYGFPNENTNEVQGELSRSTDVQDISPNNYRFEEQPSLVHNPKVTIDTSSHTRTVVDETLRVEDETIITECILFTSIQADILKNRSGQMFLYGLAERFQLPLQLCKHSTMDLDCIQVTTSKSLGLKVKELIMEFLHGKSTIENKKLYFKLKHHLELLASIPLERPSYLFDLITKSRNVKFDKYVQLNTILFGKYGLEEGKYQTKLLQDIFMQIDTTRKMNSQAAKIINNGLEYVFLTVRTINTYRRLVNISENIDMETSSNVPLSYAICNNVDISENIDLGTSSNYTFHNSMASTPEYMSLRTEPNIHTQSLRTEPNIHTQIVSVKPYCTSKFTEDFICMNFLESLKQSMKVKILNQNIVLHGSKAAVEEGAWRLKIFINNLHQVVEFPHKPAAIYETLVKSIANVNVWCYIENVRQIYDEILRYEQQKDKDFSPESCKLLGKLYSKLNAILFGKYCVTKGRKTMAEIIKWTHKLIRKQSPRGVKHIRRIISKAYFYIFDFSKKDIDYKVFINDFVRTPGNPKTTPQNYTSQKNYITSNLEKYMVIAAHREDDIKIQELELMMSMMTKLRNFNGVVRYIQDLNASYCKSL